MQVSQAGLLSFSKEQSRRLSLSRRLLGLPLTVSVLSSAQACTFVSGLPRWPGAITSYGKRQEAGDFSFCGHYIMRRRISAWSHWIYSQKMFSSESLIHLLCFLGRLQDRHKMPWPVFVSSFFLLFIHHGEGKTVCFFDSTR